MYTLILIIIIFVLARTTLRGLFNRTWKEKTQDIVWSFGNEKNFWQLMGEKINAPKVFFTYLRTRNQKDYIRVGDCIMDAYSYSSEHEIDKSDFDIKTITKTEGIRLINSTLNPRIEKVEKVITDFLTENKITFTEDEIRKSFKELEENPWSISGDVTKHYNRFMPAHLDSLIKSDRTGVGIWKVLKDFVDKEHDFEFDRSGNKHVDFLESLKMVQTDVSDFVIDLLCGKFENKDKSGKLKKELKEWQQLHMLRWCVVDYSSMRNLSILNEKIWRLIISIFL
jgi:hypothetical protein